MAARKFLNKYFEDLGEVSDIDIDPKADLLTLQARLKGELQPIWLEARYRLEDDTLIMESFRCEREWIEVTLNRYLAGHRFNINDSMMQTILKFLL